MNLFRHRPLFLVCTSFMAAASVGYLLQGWLKILLLGLLAVGLLSLLTLHLLHKIGRYRLVLSAVAVAVAMVALTESYVYINLRARAADTYVGKTRQIEAVVTEVGGSSAHWSSYTVRVERIDGESADYRAAVTCYQPADFHIGDRVVLTAEVIDTDLVVAGQKRVAYVLLANGIAFGLEVYGEEDYTVLSTEEKGFFLSMARLRKDLAARLELLCSEDAAGLPAALLLGERADIPTTVTRDFSRAGAAHLLAISGMHVSLLFGLLAGLLRILWIPPKVRAVLLGTLAFGYLAFLGFPPSATRSVIMLGSTYLACLCTAKADALTSLGLAGALILLCSPGTVADVGFWMSFSAALGLIILMSLWRKENAPGRRASLGRRLLWRIKRVGRYILTILSAGAVAMTSSLWITVGALGEISLLSPVTTLLMTPLVAFVILATPLLGILAATPLGGWIARAIGAACALMVKTTAWLGSYSWSVISLQSDAVWVVVLAMTATLGLFMIIKFPRRELVLLPVLVGWLIIGVMEGVMAELGQDRLLVDYIRPSSKSEMLVVTRGQMAVICDLSDGSYSALSDAATQAHQAGATDIAAVTLTHYHARVAGSLDRLLAGETVHQLWLPRPKSVDEYYIFLACTDVATSYGVEVTVFDADDPLTVFSHATLRVRRASLERSSHPVILLTLDADGDASDDGDILTFCGGSAFESDLADEAEVAASQADLILFGSHGPITKAPIADLSSGHAAWVGFADRDTAAWMAPSRMSPEVASLHIGEVRLTLSQRKT